MNPNEARRHRLGFDYFAKGFSPSQLTDAYYRLTADSRQEQLLMECASFSEIDEEYNPEDQNADREQTETLIMESVRVKAFSRTAQTMAALTRALNKQMADKGLSVGEAVIGKPKKSGLFATVTVQFPVSDGQTISIIFHSPDNNKMQITAQDEILAFRWLLNKRDITVAVSPEGEADVSLEEVGKRVAMLVERNAKAFASKQKDILGQKKALEDLKTTVQTEQETNQTLVNNLTEAENSVEILDRQLQSGKDQLAKAQDYNAGLQSQLDSLIAANAANAGKPQGEGEKTPEQIQAEQDAAEFEKKKIAFEEELKGRGFKESATPTVYEFGDAKWNDLNGDLTARIYEYGSGENSGYGVAVNSGRHKEYDKQFTSKTLAGLDKQVADALAWIDKKLAGMEKSDPETVDPLRDAINQAIVDPVSHEAWTLSVEAVKAMNSDDYNSIMSSLGDENYHTEALLFQSKRIGPSEYIDEAQQLLAAQNAAGSLTTALKTWRDAFTDMISGKASKQVYDAAKAAALTPPQPDNGDGSGEPAAVTILNDILAGSYSTSQEISDKLDEVAAELEAAGLMDQYDDLLNKSADYLTEILKREAA